MIRRAVRRCPDLWTPALAFGTPGTLTPNYTRQLGRLVVTGNEATADFVIVTVASTWVGSSGNLTITGLPVTAAAITNFQWMGNCPQWQGITFATATLTTMAPRISAGSNVIDFVASGSGTTATAVTTADVPSPTNFVLVGSIRFWI